MLIFQGINYGSISKFTRLSLEFLHYVYVMLWSYLLIMKMPEGSGSDVR